MVTSCTCHTHRAASAGGIAARAQALVDEIDPGTLITARKIGQVLTEDLGLTARGRNTDNRRLELLLTEEDLHALMVRYGVTRPGQPPNPQSTHAH